MLIKLNKNIGLIAVFALLLTACTKDSEFDIPELKPVVFSEDFNTAVDGTDLDFKDWTNVVISGTKKWKEESFDDNGYAEFGAFGTNDAILESWLVTPAIDMDMAEGEMLSFKVAQHHLDVDAAGNSLTVYISQDFTGDVKTATWTPLTVTLPKSATKWYEFSSSGSVDLSTYKGKIFIGFKGLGSGSDATLDGSFQLDDIKIFSSK